MTYEEQFLSPVGRKHTNLDSMIKMIQQVWDTTSSDVRDQRFPGLTPFLTCFRAGLFTCLLSSPTCLCKHTASASCGPSSGAFLTKSSRSVACFTAGKNRVWSEMTNDD